jgi:CheY-like chemotaxis protein
VITQTLVLSSASRFAGQISGIIPAHPPLRHRAVFAQSGFAPGDHVMSTVNIAKVGFIQRLLNSIGSGARPQAAIGMRVLVVDDSPTICAVLGKMLVQEDYEVLKATDGHSAIITAIREQPALIFLDVVMPGLNGFDVLRALRHDPRTQHIPIVMISGNAQATEQFYLQRFGADDFMKKPFGRDEVCHRIGQLVLCGRLTPRRAVATVPDSVNVPMREVTAQALAAIPDVAMPDVEHALEYLHTPAAFVMRDLPATHNVD